MTRITASIDTTTTIERIKALTVGQPQPVDREALRRVLIAENHDPRAIELALGRMYGYEVEGISGVTEKPSASFALSTRVATGISIANPILILVLTAALLNVLPRYISFDPRVVAVVIPFVAVLGIEGAMLPRLRRRDPDRALGLALGMGVSVVVSFFLLLPLLSIVSALR